MATRYASVDVYYDVSMSLPPRNWDTVSVIAVGIHETISLKEFLQNVHVLWYWQGFGGYVRKLRVGRNIGDINFSRFGEFPNVMDTKFQMSNWPHRGFALSNEYSALVIYQQVERKRLMYELS